MNSRNVVTNHLDSGLYKSCPVCQHAIECDYEEALSYQVCLQQAEPIHDFDLIAIGDNDVIVEGESFAIVEPHDPNKTMPPID